MYGKKLLMHQSDVEYIYDGSLQGFYCCVFECVYRYEKPCAITAQNLMQPTLFKQYFIKTDIQKAARVRESLLQHIGIDAQILIEDVFLSCVKQRELLILEFIIMGYEIGPTIISMLAHEKVAPLVHAQKHLRNEAHNYVGFVRFIEYQHILVSTITPKNFVLPYIATHFINRYQQEDFLIFDKTNKAALIYKEKKAQINPLDKIDFLPIEQDEAQYQKLWKLFFKTVSIQERENLKRQLGHMPKRYWENMTEL